MMMLYSLSLRDTVRYVIYHWSVLLQYYVDLLKLVNITSKLSYRIEN